MKILPTVKKQYGFSSMLLVLLVVMVIAVIALWQPQITPSSHDDDYCRQLVQGKEEYMTSPKGIRYKLIKEDVPVLNQWANDGKYNHYGTYEPYTDPDTGIRYVIRNPQWGAGTSYQFASDVDPDQPFSFTYADYGIVFRFQVDQNDQPLSTGISVPTFYGQMHDILFMDIFQDVNAKPLPEYVLKCQDYPENLELETMMIPGQNVSINVGIPGINVIHPVQGEPSAENVQFSRGGQVARTEDLTTIGVPEKNIKIPSQNQSSDEAQLQAEWFLLQQSKFLIHTWWAPHCKPAIYLYPPRKQLVNVKVFPQGTGSTLTYTDPLYPEGGWNVEANPDGRIINLGANNFMKQYDYLYFESKVPDSIIEMPTKGWVIKTGESQKWSTEMEAKFNDILPKLGLNNTQTNDFIEYWKKALPESPYYFIGIIDQSTVDQIERLEITPKPDSVNRVRIYFERLDQAKSVEAPMLEIKPFALSDTEFKVVEWGGMVKNDPNHPFTCSQ